MTVDITKPGATPGEPAKARTVLAAVTAGREPKPAIDTTEPIRPEWLRTWDGFRSTAGLAVKRATYRTTRFLLHLPVLVALLVLYSPRGLGRLTAIVSRYLYDYDSATVRHAHAGNMETAEYVKAQNVRKANLKARWMVAGTALFVLLVPVLAWTFPAALAVLAGLAVFVWTVKLIPGKEMWELGVAAGLAFGAWWVTPLLAARIPAPPLWAVLGVAVVAVLALGWVGRPAGRQMVKKTDLAAAKIMEKPTAPMIIEALCSLGNSKMSVKTQEETRTQVGLIIDGVRSGPGWQFHLLLPKGVTAAWVMEKRAELAGAMRFPLGTVWPSVGTHNPAHLVLNITDKDLKDVDQEPWPLLCAERVDISKPQPVGTNQQGDWVTAQLAYANVIIGAVPRVGKTFFLRELLMMAGLDPHVQTYVIDGKGTGDLSPCAVYAHRYQRGVRSTRPELIEKVREMVRELRREMDRRADIIDSLPHDECPESKVTGDLIKGRPDLNLGWIVFALDETQMVFGYGDADNKEHKKIRQELKAGVEELVKLGPALGIIVILATQDVVEDTVPNQVSRMAVIRMCMKVEDDKSNNRILGAGAYGRGLNATMFTQDDLGIGYLKSEGATPQIVRTVWGLDKPACEALAYRARQLRIDAGTLTGDAIGEQGEAAFEVDLLADVRDVMNNPPVPRMHLLTLNDRLSLLRPTTWGHLDPESLGGILRAAGVPVVQVKLEGRNTSGVRREDLAVAATSNIDPDDVAG